LIDALKNKGIETAYVTLHIGAGTFQPVKTEDLDQHVMHSEYMEVSQNVCDAVLQCKKNKGRVIAVGTSVLRSLETASLSGKILPSQGETELFIRPGFQFHTVDGLVTNLHLPQSTLLVLVATFAGYHLMKQAYQEAIAQKYRFYSYGDAMLILR
jgi:S-adenosylmethionine:tRNA ribosyltransferase-isomerase